MFGSTNLDHRSFSINDEVNVASNDVDARGPFSRRLRAGPGRQHEDHL